MSREAKSPIVAVILSTYNGEKYLPQQLESLGAQNYRPNCLVLRDDGSSDSSVDLVANWALAEGIPLLRIGGARLGPCRSFLHALSKVDTADIYLFCDQDDFWLPNKISRAVSVLPYGKGVEPTLYATRLSVVDEELNPLRLSLLPIHLTFASACCESVLTGCTMAFNGAFRDHLVRSAPRQAAMHDWWCYLLATGIHGARLIYDPTPTVLYRQHNQNVLGAGPTGGRALLHRVKRFFSSHARMRSRQLKEFQSLNAPFISPQASRLLGLVVSGQLGFRYRVRAALVAPIRRQTLLQNLSTRLSLLANRF